MLSLVNKRVSLVTDKALSKFSRRRRQCIFLKCTFFFWVEKKHLNLCKTWVIFGCYYANCFAKQWKSFGLPNFEHLQHVKSKTLNINGAEVHYPNEATSYMLLILVVMLFVHMSWCQGFCWCLFTNRKGALTGLKPSVRCVVSNPDWIYFPTLSHGKTVWVTPSPTNQYDDHYPTAIYFENAVSHAFDEIISPSPSNI